MRVVSESVPRNIGYEVVPGMLDPECWRAEFVDYESDGECYVVIFTGPDAEGRARRYAEWMNATDPAVVRMSADPDE